MTLFPSRRRRRTPPPAPSPEPRHSGRVRRWLIPALGAVTPTGLIVVNIAVFIYRHLDAFRWTIAILAFVSGMMLNSWIGLKIYRVLQRRYRENFLVSEVNQDMVLIGGMAVIIGASFVTALFCYLGLSSARDLPNPMTFLTGVFAILVPLVLQFIFERVLGGGRRSGGDAERPVNPFGGSTLPPPPPPPPFSRAPDRSAERQR